MYDRELDFVGDLNAQRNAYFNQKPRWYRINNWGQEVGGAWRLYSNARANALGMLLLGGADLRDDDDLLANMGTTAAVPAQNGRGATTFARRASASNTTGSVLKERYWWPMKNDAWVIGGLHGLAEFHLAAPSIDAISDEELWDAHAGRPRVLGRELIGLFNFGYIRISHAHEASLGLVFAPDNTAHAQGADFATYLDRLRWVTCASNIRSMLAANRPYMSYAKPG